MKRKFTRLFLIHLLTLVALGASAKDTIVLAWDPSPSTNVVGYTLYWGASPGSYSDSTNLNNVTLATNVVPSGTLRYFVVTARDDNGLESDPSNEISYQAPGPVAPGTLRIDVVIESGTNLLSWIERAKFEMPVTALLDQEFWRARMTVTPEPPVPISPQ